MLLSVRSVLLAGLLLAGVPVRADLQPHIPDGFTRVLFHFDEPAGSTAITNLGTMGGPAYGVNMTTASTNPPLTTSILGATGLSGFGNAANFNSTGYSIGFDADGSGIYQGETYDVLLMSDLNMGNGGTTPWTLEALIYPTVTNVNQEIITTDSSAGARGFQFRLNTAGQLELNLIALGINPKTALPTTGPHAYAASNWFHVAATYDGANIVLYWTKVSVGEFAVNPISTNAAIVDASFGAVAGPLVIGNENRGPAGEQFRGLIDEVRISSVARYLSGKATNYTTVTQQPGNVAAVVGGSAQFSIAAATSYPPLFYRWHVGSPGSGAPVVSPDANGATYTGLTGPTLTVNSATLANNEITFFCVVTNSYIPPTIATSTAALLTVSNFVVVPSDPAAPGGLMVNLLAFPERTTIPNVAPKLSWIFKPVERGEVQTAREIIVSSTPVLAANTNGDVWASGMVASGGSVNVSYGGPLLSRGSNYTWRVRTWGSSGSVSPWSEPQSFTIEPTLPPANARSIRNSSSNQWSGRYQPAFDTTVAPASFVDKGAGNYFIDFGRAGFGYVTLRLNGNFAGQSVQVRFGEKANGTSVNTSPGGTIRYGSTTVPLANGDITYEVHKSSTSVGINISWSGGVMPFRYVELLNCPATVTTDDIRQKVLHVPFDDNAASFTSSDSTLNAIWELCRYSMKVTTFCGVYVDGDRERKPYEADAYINQLSHYGVDREFATARYSYEYLLDNPTWPTEWRLHFAPMAWADYMATGNADALAINYVSLKTQLLTNWVRAADGIMVSQTSGTPMDIVDWPAGERDGYVLTTVNTVVNAFHYQALRLMAQIATVLENTTDADDFTARADTLKDSFNTVFWNDASQLYQDGETTPHISAHANFIPLAFGLVPSNRVASVASFLKTKRMPCSVYGAQYLLEALFEAGEADHAIRLMSDNDPTYKRHWWNMLAEGSTVTLEAWDNDFKSNLDWNHAWGAAPGNIVPRYVLGLRPLTPGYESVEIKPQLGTGAGTNGLASVSSTIPTIRGPVGISAENATNDFKLLVMLPGNLTAKVVLPTKGLTNAVALVNGNPVAGTVSNGCLTVTNIGSGQHALWIASAPVSLSARYDNWTGAYFGTNSTNASIAGQSADPDQDGHDNYSEFIADMDPLDAGSVFKIDSVQHDLSLPLVLMTVQGRAGRQYFLETTSQLDGLTWNVVATSGMLATNQTLLLQDNAATASQRLYRVRVSL
jgi:alpha-L-rhamnosidase